ncbi:MAG: glycosyltransferase [Nitrososphaera sp.]|nr:glycosyltransferase [Nitrososphaera sp.]
MRHQRKQFAIYLPSLTGGGAERAMLNLAQGLAECGYAVDLVLAQAKGPYLGDVHAPIRLVDLKASRVLTSLPALARYLRRERPAALISALDYANVVALWARRLAGIPSRVLVNEQNTISHSARNSVRWRQRMVPHLVRRFYPWADYVIGNSQGVADDLSQVAGLHHERIKILYNPVVTLELREKARVSLNHPWFKASQPPVVLAVGRLTRQKDFPTLIRAFARVRQTRPARLLILGEGPDRPALEALVNQLGLEDDVALPGFVENPYAYMSRASLYVLSSRWEGLPTVLIEALYCGPPIIATDCPSGPREILADGQHGLLVPVGDVMTLTQAIGDGLAGKTPHPTEESWQRYSLETVVDQYLGLLLNGQT